MKKSVPEVRIVRKVLLEEPGKLPIELPSGRVHLTHFHEAKPRPTAWLIDGLIPEDSCVVMGGQEKAGKTWLCFDIAIALATRGRVLDRWRATRSGRTLIVSPEGSPNARCNRLYGLCWGRKVAPEAVGPLLPIWPGRIDLHSKESMGQLRATLEAEQPDLLVIDPFVTATSGLDENTAGDMQAVLNQIRDLREFSRGMSIVVTHHESKRAGMRSPLQSLRGSSTLGAWLDGLIRVQRESDDAASPRRVDVEHRDNAPADPAGFTLEFTDGKVKDVQTVRLRTCDPPAPHGGTRRRTGENHERLVSLIIRHPGKYDATAAGKLLNLEAKRSQRLAKDLCEQDRLRRSGGKLIPGRKADRSGDSRPGSSVAVSKRRHP
ncbi:MAG: AAA family ATPase [Deltaproteobacteria bacterium]|nr:AAA family ATPase [Deltaproteobacteria bacterium]